ncbi:sugar ABC transporter permease [Psychromicrobium lacuslunae]|uniref:Sugar ABC transporter permease n=1 Tax=Psychromicrobium lacuslunae TaxID=1618207 RepID=A0A0D4BWJ3_9MICC|nr:sugar ABC transporter permease [Psychromicrobium lacuslunae]
MRQPSRRRRQTLVAWMFCLPFVAVFATFMLMPIGGSLAMSFTDITSRDLQTPFAVGFVGLDQYLSLLGDQRFLTSLAVTGLFVLIGIPITIGFALALAVGLNTGRGRIVTILRVGYYAPAVTSIVAISVAWKYILQPDGLLNAALGLVGIPGVNWLNDPVWALPSLIMLAVWRNVGTLMVIFLAGLQSIPKDLLEAATMDGAGAWRRFFGVTLPMLRPTILLGAVLISVGYLQFFEEAFVMTGGGPLDRTLSVAFYTYQQFGVGQYGRASAASYILFLLVALLSLLQFRLLRRKD